MNMKKLILALSYTFGSIALVILIGALLFNIEWLHSFNNMKPDSDTGSSYSYHMTYDNGTLTVKYYDGERYDIITPDSKRTIKLPIVSLSTYYFEDYILLPNSNYLQIFDMQGTELARIKADSNIRGYKCENKNGLSVTYLTEKGDFYSYTLATNKTEQIIHIDSNIDNYYFKDSYLYIEELLYEETTKAVFYKYNLNTSKLIETHTIDLGEDITKGISVVREVSNQKIIDYKDYTFFMFNYNNYGGSKLFRYNKADKKTEFVSELICSELFGNSRGIYFAGSFAENNDCDNGIWKIDIDTLNPTQITTDYIDRELIITDNYIYAYENMDISNQYFGITIRRGYDIKQIPIT